MEKQLGFGARGTWHELKIGFDEVLARLPEALQGEGFGIITQIDLQQTFKAKLGVDFRRYRIFGACNPTFALQALTAEPRVGLLLPCNIVLYERDDRGVVLGVINPVEQLGASEGQLATLAEAIRERLQRVTHVLEG